MFVCHFVVVIVDFVGLKLQNLENTALWEVSRQGEDVKSERSEGESKQQGRIGGVLKPPATWRPPRCVAVCIMRSGRYGKVADKSIIAWRHWPPRPIYQPLCFVAADIFIYDQNLV